MALDAADHEIAARLGELHDLDAIARLEARVQAPIDAALRIVDQGNARRREQVRGREASPVGRPDFKSGMGRQTILGRFDSYFLPPFRLGRFKSA